MFAKSKCSTAAVVPWGGNPDRAWSRTPESRCWPCRSLEPQCSSHHGPSAPLPSLSDHLKWCARLPAAWCGRGTLEGTPITLLRAVTPSLSPFPRPGLRAGRLELQEVGGQGRQRRRRYLGPGGTPHTSASWHRCHCSPPTGGSRKESKAKGQGRGGPRPETHFSLPSPTTAILLLSSVQAMSLIFPAKG